MTAILLSVSLAQAFQPSISLHRQLQHQHINTSTLLPLDASSAKTSEETKPTSHSSNPKRSRRKSHSGKKRRKSQQRELKNPTELETWRIYGVDVNPDNLGPIVSDKRRRTDNISDALPSERAYLTPPVLSSLLARLRIEPCTVEEVNIDGTTKISLPPQLRDARVVRRSVDARRRRGADPKYTYVVDIITTREVAVRELKLVHQPGRVERIGFANSIDSAAKEVMPSNEDDGENESNSKPKIIIGENECAHVCIYIVFQPAVWRGSHESTPLHFSWCWTSRFVLCTLIGIIWIVYTDTLGAGTTGRETGKEHRCIDPS